LKDRQPKALANAVVAYASNIDNLGVLGGAVELIAHKHCALAVKPEHYSIVEKNLMIAIGEVLGSAVTPEIGGAWEEAVKALSNILITREEELYKEAASKSGGFRDWKPFVVTGKEEVAKDTIKYRFAPADGSSDPIDFNVGQFLTLRVDTGEEYPLPRHYTLVNEPGQPFLEVCVRTVVPENGNPAGAVSTHLQSNVNVGDNIDLMPPFGVFDVNPKNMTGDILCLSGGIGIAQTQHFLRRRTMDDGRKVIAVHQDRTPASHPFKDCVDHADYAFNKYSRVEGGGHISTKEFDDIFHAAGVDPSNTRVIMCGPNEMMNDYSDMLKNVGVLPQHMKAKVMGPQLSTQHSLT